MTNREREMFEQSFKRPSNFFQLPEPQQWDIDKKLGILSWKGNNLNNLDMIRFKKHYDKKNMKHEIYNKNQRH